MNLNDTVWVRLNEHGWTIYRSEFVRLGLDDETAAEALREKTLYGWSPFKLWELMHTFGEATVIGHPTPFDGNEMRTDRPGNDRTYCDRKVASGELIAGICDYCGHNNALHPGANKIDACLACELAQIVATGRGMNRTARTTHER